MSIDRAGAPFIGGALAIACILGIAFAWVYAIPFVLVAAFFLFFFRDPDRQPPADPADDLVLSPADGRVLVAGPAVPEGAPEGTWLQVSIFLSPMDVHVNRVPVSGRIAEVRYKAGRFLPAYRHESGSENERSEIWIDHRGQRVIFRQIVGVLARRVVCRAAPGMTMRAGDRFGIMKFGSRMDVFLPATAEIRVTVGETVRGGETVIAVLR
jgi:phosphatidylserine decarboxylase